MKKKLALFVLIIFGTSTGILLGQSITVTKPANGETWNQSQNCTITWTKSGTMPDTVKITLREPNAPTVVLTIADGVPNSGSCQWLVPASVAPGQYKIRVKVKDAPILDDSGAFTIAGASAASITVTKPAAGEKWTKTKPYAVTWTKTGTMPGSVKIDLYDKNGTAVVKPIAASATNSGSFSWTVPGDAAVGDYRIRVKANGANVQDDSEVFHVASALTPGGVGAATTKVQEKPPFKAAVAQAPENIKYVPAQCTNWMQTLPIQAPKQYSQARPKPCPNVNPYDYARVGHDHFSYQGTNSNGDPYTGWIADVYRSKVYFFIEDIKNNVPLRDRLIEAKMKFKQIESIRANTNHASCATGMGVLQAMWTDWWNPPVAHMVGLSFGSTEYLVDVTETVRNWLTGGEVNYGFLLVSEKDDVTQENITCFSCYEIKLVLKFKED